MSNVHVKKISLYVFVDNEAVIKMIIKGRRNNETCFRPTELRLIGCSIESIWTSKSKSNTSTPKANLADILIKGNFTRDEWNHLFACLMQPFQFYSVLCCNGDKIQQESGEERVTAKSRPMMNLTARVPSIVSSSASSNPVKTWCGYQDPGNSVVVDDPLRQH